MMFDPEKRHRRSIRLKEYDYSQPGAYSITIFTRDRECLFGETSDGTMELNDIGQIAYRCLEDIPNRYPTLAIDVITRMPNHVHGIILLGVQFIAPDTIENRQFDSEDVINHTPALGNVIRAFEAIPTRQIRQFANPGFGWQRNYYEHIVRNEKSLNSIRQYIAKNPLNWDEDK